MVWVGGNCTAVFITDVMPELSSDYDDILASFLYILALVESGLQLRNESKLRLNCDMSSCKFQIAEGA